MSILLITGGSGKLGSELKKIYPDALIPTRNELDITKRENVFEYINKNAPDIIIHTAALTNVRLCEENKELAWLTNAEGTKNIIDALNEINKKTRLVYISTACVFSGNGGNYNEKSIPYPKNFYAITKLAAETMVSQYKPSLIIRTNFVSRERWLFDKSFVDRYGTYLFADEVAAGIKDVLSMGLDGIVHVCGIEKMSMHELAKITRHDVGEIRLDNDGKFQGLPLTRDMSLDSIRIPKYSMKKFINNI